METIFFDHPAARWEEALPVGNGRLGAMIFGGIRRERLSLNQDSIWYGGPVDRVNPDAKGHLEEVRRLLLTGKIPEAEKLLSLAFSGTPQGERPYQTLGDLELSYPDTGEGAEGGEGGADGGKPGENGRETPYRRELNLREGMVTEQYALAGSRLGRSILPLIPTA